MKRIIYFIFFIAITFNSIAQIQSKFTHHLTAEEKANWHLVGKNFQETDPPDGEVRNIAEWEQMEGVLIAYYYGFGIPYSLIAEMSQDCIVTTIVTGASQENTVRGYYNSNGVNLDNCNFLHSLVDSYWTRDYTAWYIAVDNSEVSVIDFPYNRPWRDNDDDMPIKIAEFLDIPLYGMDVIHTGGNYMTDGMGISASTTLVLSEETQTQAQIEQKMSDYLGIETYHLLDDPTEHPIQHIDCWGKFLDVDKILITQVPAEDNRYEDFEAAAAYFAEQNCSYGIHIKFIEFKPPIKISMIEILIQTL